MKNANKQKIKKKEPNKQGPNRSASHVLHHSKPGQPRTHGTRGSCRNGQAKPKSSKETTIKQQQKQTKKQATKAKQTAEAKTRNSPGNDKRPLWPKNARAGLTKPSKAEEFARKSKEAALKHSRELMDQATRARRLLYSRSLVNQSFTS